MKRFLEYLHPINYINVGYQLIFLTITFSILALLTYKPFVEFHPVGPKPLVKPHEIAAQKNVVSVGMHISDFLKFDTVKNEFILNAFIWFEYDPIAIMPELIEAFAFTKGEIIQKSAPIITQHNGKTRALYMIRVQFSSILDFARFPLDDHRIFLNLINSKATAEQLIYHADQSNFVISKNLFLSGWKFVGHAVENGLTPIALNDKDSFTQQKTVFSVDVSKNDFRQLILIIFPLLFLFYLGLFAFSIRDINIAITLPLASISGLFAYSFVIQILAPMVGYMMMSDYFFLFFLFSTFIIFLVKALAAVPEAHLSRNNLRTIEGITVVALQIVLIIVWFIVVDVRDI